MYMAAIAQNRTLAERTGEVTRTVVTKSHKQTEQPHSPIHTCVPAIPARYTFGQSRSVVASASLDGREPPSRVVNCCLSGFVAGCVRHAPTHEKSSSSIHITAPEVSFARAFSPCTVPPVAASDSRPAERSADCNGRTTVCSARLLPPPDGKTFAKNNDKDVYRTHKGKSAVR